VGSFDMIKLCNKTGWTYSFNKIESGSLLKLSWSSDGTTLSGAGVSIEKKFNFIYIKLKFKKKFILIQKIFF
jgi:hypothetical protein